MKKPTSFDVLSIMASVKLADIQDVFDDFRGGSSIFFVSTYLDSPILTVPRNQFLADFLNERPIGRSRQLIIALRGENIGLHNMEPVNPQMYPAMVEKYRERISVCRTEWNTALTTSENIIGSLSSALKDRYGLSSSLTLPSNTSHAFTWYTCMRFWETYLESYRTHRAKGGRAYQKIVGPYKRRAWTDGNIWVMDTPETKNYLLLTHEQVCMLKDLCYSRHQTLFFSSLLYGPDMQLLIERLWQWQETCLQVYGNSGYEIAKSTESLSKAYLPRLTSDPMRGVGDSYDMMIIKVNEKERVLCRKLNTVSAELAYKFTDILNDCTSVQQVVELFGIQKMCGHPLIDPELGGLTAASHARSSDVTRFSDALHTRACFMRIFLESYVKRHSSWPPFDCPPRSGTTLFRLWKQGHIRLHARSYPLDDWENVVVGKVFELDTFPNYTELMDDKSISFYRSDRACQWTDKKPSSHRRLLLEMLTRYTIEPEKVIDAVTRRDIPEAWKIVTLYPKEREFKLSPRMFSMLVFEIRLFFTLHEANLASSVLPYFPQLTMTDTRSIIRGRFLEMTKPHSGDELSMFIELDLAAWNLKWRELMAGLIGQDANHLFGVVGVFDFVHQFFADSMIMVRVADLKPEGIELDHPPESDLLWYDHLGGFEGIAQKLWSLCTVAMIDRALYEEPISYRLTIQGDNVVVSARCPLQQGTNARISGRYWLDRITHLTSKSAADVNQELKPEECLGSQSVVSYSKDVYVDGAEHFLSLKFHSRLFPVTSVDFPSMANNVGAIFSGAIAGAERVNRPMLSYIAAVFHASLYLSRVHSPINTAAMTTREIEYILLKPSELGGWPIIGPFSFLYKGAGDPLAKSLCSLVLLQDHNATVRKILGEARHTSSFVEAPKLASLIQDPYGLPVVKAISPNDAVAEETRSVLRVITKNHHILPLVSERAEEYAQCLISHIASVTPFNPVILRDIYDCSLAGVMEMIRRMFLATRTIQLASRESNTDMVTKVLIAGDRQVDSLLQSYRRRGISPCTVERRVTGGWKVYEFVQELRARWNTLGIKIEGIGSYSPLDFGLVVGRKQPPGILAEAHLSPSSNLKRGLLSPYFGSATREKRSDHGYKLVGSSLPTKALVQLHDIATQACGPNMRDMIDMIGLSRSNLVLSSVRSLMSEVIGGNCAHRYAARIGQRSASLLGQSVFASHCAQNSNHAGFVSASTVDYPIMFQEHFLYLTSILHLRHLDVIARPWDALSLNIGGMPLEELPADAMDIPSANTIPRLTMPGNPLVYVSQRLDRTRGPTRDYAFKVCEDLSVGDRETAVYAVISLTRQEIQGMSLKQSSVARTMGFSSTLKPDILEIAGLGLRPLLESMAYAMAEDISTMIISTKHFTAKDIHHSTLRSLLKTADGLRAYASHPLLQSEPLLLSAGAPNLRYAVTNPLANRLVRVISRKCIALVNNPDSDLYMSPTVLFSSDPQNSLSAAILLRVRLAVLQCFLKEKRKDALEYTTQLRLVSLETFRTETERCTRLHMTVWAMADEAYSAGLSSLAENFMSIARGRMIRISRLDASEALRFARKLTPPPCDPIPPIQVTSPMLPLFEYAGQVLDTPGKLSWLYDDRTETNIEEMRSNFGRPVACGSSALEEWWKVRALFAGRLVLIIGSGLGGCAAAALAGGATGVRGHDLRRDIPVSAEPDEDHIPICVRWSGQSPRYLQTAESSHTSGDWYDNSVRLSLYRYMTPHDLLVLDIRSPGYAIDLSPLLPIIQDNYRGVVITRLKGRIDQLRSAMSTIYSRFHIIYLAQVKGEVQYQTWIASLQIRGEGQGFYTSLTTICQPAKLVYDPTVPEDEGFYTLLIFGLTTVEETRPEGEAIDAIIESCEGELGVYSTRPDYGTWTEVLVSWLACNMLKYGRVYAVACVREAGETGFFQINRGDRPSLQLRATKETTQLVVRYVSRLL